MRLFKDIFRSLNRTHAEAGDIREYVECAARTHAREAVDPVQPVDDQPAVAVVVLHHVADVLFAVIDGLDSGQLHGFGHAGDHVLVQLDEVFHDVLVGADVAHAETRHSEGLRQAVDRQHIILQPFAAGSKAFLHKPVVNEALVRFIRDDEQLVLFHQLADGAQVILIQHAAGGIRRRIDDNQLRLIGNQRLDDIGCHLEAVFLADLCVNRFAVDHIDLSAVIRPVRALNDDLIAGVDKRDHGQHQRLRGAGSDDQVLFGIALDAVFLFQLPGDGLAQFADAGVGRILRLAGAQPLDTGLNDVIGRDKTRLAKGKVDGIIIILRQLKHAAHAGRPRILRRRAEDIPAHHLSFIPFPSRRRRRRQSVHAYRFHPA